MNHFKIFAVMMTLFTYCSCRHTGNDSKVVAVNDSRSDTIRINLESTFLVQNPNYQVYYADSVGIGHPLFFADGENLLVSKTPVFLIEPTTLQSPYFLFPGEEVQLVTVDNRVRLVKPGDTLRNAELALLADLCESTGALFSTGFDPEPFVKKVAHRSELQDLLGHITKKKVQREDFLKEYVAKRPISERYKEIVEQTIADAARVDSMRAMHLNTMILSKTEEVDFFKKSLIDFNKRKDTFARGFFLTGIQLMEFFNGQRLSPNSDKELITLLKSISENFEGDAERYFIKNTLQLAQRNLLLTPAVRAESSEILEDDYLQVMDKLIAQRKKLESKGVDVLQGHDLEISVDSLLSKYKGKIVLIDFWAGWCQPCIMEIPHGKQLTRQYADKGFVILYFSMDENEKDWQIAEANHISNTKNSFWIPNPSMFSYLKEFKIKTIPRYLLIDRDGKMINENAPRPSSEELKTWLKQNL